MRGKLCFLIIACLFCLCLPTAAAEFDGQAALDELYQAAPEQVIQHINDPQLTTESVSEAFSMESLIDILTSQLVSTFTDNIGMMISVIGVLVLMGIYDTLRDSFASKGTEKIADFFCAAAVALVICPPLMERANELGQVIHELSDYMKISLPILSGLLVASGNTGSATVLHFFIYHAAALAGNLFSGVLLPLASTYMSIGIAATITDNDGLKNLASSIRTITTKAMVFFCTIFTALLSLQGVIAGAGDTISRRTLKLAVGSFVPVAGSLMSESVDTFMSGVGVIRSVAGVFGVIVIFYLIIIPILKTLSNYLLVKISAFVGDMIGTIRIRSLLTVVADGYGMILSIATGVGIMFIVCMAFLLIIGGAT